MNRSSSLRHSRGGAIRRGAVCAAAAGGAAALWGLAEAERYTVRHRSLLMDQHVEDARPLRILHLSDIHLMPYQKRKMRWLASLAQTKPDLIILTGDQIGSTTSLSLLLETLAPLAGIPGAFVYGSNDYYSPRPKNPFIYFKRTHPIGDIEPRERDLPWQEMTTAFESFGWLNLNNTRASISTAGWDIQLVGVDDPHIELDEYPLEVKSESGTPVPSPTHQRVKIGLTHAPYSHVLDQMAAEGCTAVFSGHTHGGQVCVPGAGALVTNCDLDPKHASGLFQWPLAGEGVLHGDGIVPTGTEPRPTSWVNVSAGIGASPTVPVRFACPPEAIVVDFLLV